MECPSCCSSFLRPPLLRWSRRKKRCPGVVPVTYSEMRAPSACAPVHASSRRCFPCGPSHQPYHSTPRPDRDRPPPRSRAHRPGGQGQAVPPVGRQRKPHTSPAQISVLPSPGSTVCTRRCHPLAFTSVSPIFDQRRSRDPPADVPARLQENSGTTPRAALHQAESAMRSHWS